MNLERFNALPRGAAGADLSRCCGSSYWVNQMLAGRPFTSLAALVAASEKAWLGMADADWLEAFRHHPKIGGMDSLRERFATTAAWAEQEQAFSEVASDATLQELKRGNEAYEQKFHFIFIICATGKSALEMLAALQQRLPNDAATELRLAAEEQKKITRLRLEKLP